MTDRTFEEFLKRVRPKLGRVLSLYRVPPDDAEDVLQQSLLALVYQWDEVRNPEAWLMGTLRNKCRLYWRGRHRRLYDAVDVTLLEEVAEAHGPTPERLDMLHDLRCLVADLPPRHQALLQLRYRLGYAPAEVAERLGYSPTSIGKVTNRCLATLSRQLDAKA